MSFYRVLIALVLMVILMFALAPVVHSHADGGGAVAGVPVSGDAAGGHGAALAVGGSLIIGTVIAKGIDFVRSQLFADASLSRRQNLGLVFVVVTVVVLFAAFSTRQIDLYLIIATIAQQTVIAVGAYAGTMAAKAGGTSPKPSV